MDRQLRNRPHHLDERRSGAPRITTELRENGERVNHKRAARVMRSITPPV
ncbi:IS3 family transposase [Streptomyces sp. NPDC055107]